MKHPVATFTSACLFAALALASLPVSGAENHAAIPESLDALWAGFDPRAQPLDTEITKEWEEDGILLRVVRYTVGTFKGQKSIMGAIYGFPKGGSKLPAIVDIHGGGQAAYLPSVFTAAKRGYACISLNWGGNKMNMYKGPEYSGPNTDWGALDATHPPQRSSNNNFVSIKPTVFTLDSVDSPRNSNWYLVLMAARRAVTFLEQQPEVDGSRIGAQGHSMGGKLTTNLVAIEPRIRCAVPSCGGSGNIPPERTDLPGCVKKTISTAELNCVDDNAYLPRIQSPILWLSPTNDFNGILDNMSVNWNVIPERLRQFSIAPHFNHRNSAGCSAAAMLFFRQHLQGAKALPSTPEISWTVSTSNGIPQVSVQPDTSRAIQRVDIFYSIDPHVYTRFWRDAGAVKTGDIWTASCPIVSTQDPLFVFANVHYALSEEEKALAQLGIFPLQTGVFTLSSRVLTSSAEQLRSAGVRATDAFQQLIDDGSRGFHDWYLLEPGQPSLWSAYTRKLKDPKWRGPDGAKLVFEITSETDNTLVVRLNCADWDAFPGQRPSAWAAVKQLKGSPQPQTISVSVEDFIPASLKTEGKLANWRTVTELGIGPSAKLPKDGREEMFLGKPWKGSREVRNLRWEGGTPAPLPAASAVGAARFSESQKQSRFNEAIQQSLEQEKRDRGGK